jgi:propanediol dehydratase large subunit
MQLVASRGDFKEAFEDIMFSTKVVITNRDEFIDFIKHLSTEGFQEMALSYLDVASNAFGDDQEILALYYMAKGEEK